MITGEPLPGEEMLSRLGEGGAGTLRVNFAWGYVQSGPGARYDWSHYDSVVANAARNGIRVLATVYSSPAWAEPTPEHPPLGDALPGFQAFVRAAAQRYGARGSFWHLHPDVPRLPITAWQLWNEPNSPLFWKPTPDPDGYLTLLQAFHSALRAAPGASVVLGGLFPTPTGGLTMGDFLRRVYARGGGDLLDAVAVHPYAATPEISLRRVGQVRELMRRLGDPGVPIWIGEVGWASAGAPSGLTVGPERQADYLRRIFELASGERRRLGIAGVIWFSLQDAPGRIWVGHCGLFELDGDPKPAWSAFVDLTGGET